MEKRSTNWEPGYQKRDIEIVDYHEHQIDRIAENLRGPKT